MHEEEKGKVGELLYFSFKGAESGPKTNLAATLVKAGVPPMGAYSWSMLAS